MLLKKLKVVVVLLSFIFLLLVNVNLSWSSWLGYYKERLISGEGEAGEVRKDALKSYEKELKKLENDSYNLIKKISVLSTHQIQIQSNSRNDSARQNSSETSDTKIISHSADRTHPKLLIKSQSDSRNEVEKKSETHEPRKPFSDPPHTSIKPVDVVFPSTTNCTRRDFHKMMNTTNGPPNPTRDVYPCKLWREIGPRAKWPAVFPPTNGSILRNMEIRHEDPEIDALMHAHMKIQEDRVSRLKSTCLSHPDAAVPQTFHLVWDTSRDPPLVYCPIYKVASTTWTAYFLRLAHVNDDNPALSQYKPKSRDKKKYMPRFGGGHRRMAKEYPAPKSNEAKRKVFKRALRFLVVRHPFSRLLSAYRDKIETRKPKPFQPYFLDLQRAIIQKYRRTDTQNSSLTPTFPEFVNYVIDSTANLTTMKDWHKVVCWTPYWVQCGVCGSDFQVVIKLETMAEEEQFLAHLADLKEIQNHHEWRNLKKYKSPSVKVLPDYYKTLTEHQVRMLYERYKLDFELFDYDIAEYLDYVKQGR